jgi:hypothetical protein
LAATKAELYGLLSGVNLPAGVTAAYDHEPLKVEKPVALTISTAGMDPEFYQLTIRLYHTLEVDVAEAQSHMDDLILLVEERLSSGFNRTAWTVGADMEANAWVAACTVLAGRED